MTDRTEPNSQAGGPSARASSYVSDLLTHFVGRGKTAAEQYEILKKILTTRWLTHPPHDQHHTLGLEVHPGRKFCGNEMLNPTMVCFCDIPVEQLRIHTTKYSQFGIAFKKEYLIQQGANPVFYVAMNSGVFRKKKEHREGLKKETVSPEKYKDLKREPVKIENYGLEPRAQILDEHMELFWRLWYEKEPFERGEAGNAVAETLKREKLLLVFFIQHVFGFVKCFDDGLAPDHPDNFYMEREWRRLGNLHFAAADVAAVLVPPDMVDQCRRECAEYADRVQGLSRL